MDSFLFRKFKDSLDEPQLYQQEGRHVLLRKLKATIPVILSAPHGGGDKNFPTGAALSMKPRLPGGKNVSMKSDLYTLQLLASIDKNIFELTSQRCYIVASTVHRRYVDANRKDDVLSEENPYNPECAESKAYYEAYHSSLRQVIEDCRLNHKDAPFALLLDIHGQATFGDMVVLGTKNRSTCGCGRVDVPLRGFIWHFQALLGRAVLPYPGEKDIVPYRGGHIVCSYGTTEQEQQQLGDERQQQVAAVQLEFGSSLRSESSLRAVAAYCTAQAVVRSLWPVSCLGISINSLVIGADDISNSGGVTTHPLAQPLPQNVRGTQPQRRRAAQLVSLHPPTGERLEAPKSLSEHAALAGLVESHGKDLVIAPTPSHPWLHSLAFSPSGGLTTTTQFVPSYSPSYGCGEQGHAIIRRLFFPGIRHAEEHQNGKDCEIDEKKTNADGEDEAHIDEGYLQGIVYAHSSGPGLKRCEADEMEKYGLSNRWSDGGRVHGKLVTLASDGELAMAQLEYEQTYLKNTESNINKNANNISMASSCKAEEVMFAVNSNSRESRNSSWDICQVNVTRSSGKVVYFLAFFHTGDVVL